MSCWRINKDAGGTIGSGRRDGRGSKDAAGALSDRFEEKFEALVAISTVGPMPTPTFGSSWVEAPVASSVAPPRRLAAAAPNRADKTAPTRPHTAIGRVLSLEHAIALAESCTDSLGLRLLLRALCALRPNADAGGSDSMC
eukprot:1970073-Pleurochrysis_carterae.AAC.3